DALAPPGVGAVASIATRRRARRRIAEIVAVVVLAAGGALGVARSSRDHPSPAAPSGVTPHHIVRPDLGFSIDIPQSWLDTSALYGTAFGFGSTLDAGKQRGYANAALVSGATLQAAANDWSTRVKEAPGGS